MRTLAIGITIVAILALFPWRWLGCSWVLALVILGGIALSLIVAEGVAVWCEGRQ